jgi:glycosyltransferase involved in cell wall biosynthesis
MKLALCTLVLNEMEWLPKLYEQHKNWPGLVEWVFVEAADKVYAETNPELVSADGLSVDGTTEYLTRLAAIDKRITHIKYGFTKHKDPALGKVAARQAYLDYLVDIRPEFIMILDADEFYMQADQSIINNIMESEDSSTRHFCFQFTHPWHPACIQEEPLFTLEVVGGFWDMRHTKGIRWSTGLRYAGNHQRPEDPDLAGNLKFYSEPSCIHMAFAASHTLRKAKNDYYKARGEAADRRRRWYCESRSMFETWKPGDSLPRGAEVKWYRGPIPECFINEEKSNV